MSTSLFRGLLVLSVVLGLFGSFVDVLIPQLLPAAFQKAQAQHEETMSAFRATVVIGLSVVAFAVYAAACYGLYTLRPWAPRASVVGTALALLVLPAVGATAQSGLGVACSYAASYLWGAVLVVAHLEPFRQHFKRGDA